MEYTVSGRRVQVYAAEGACLCVWVCTFGDEGEALAAAYQALPDALSVCLVTVDTPDWDDALSPWAAPPLGKKQPPFGGRAEAFLHALTAEILPEICAAEGVSGLPQAIAGYSLAGLFALYALTKTDRFAAAASVSGSLWFPGFRSYFETHVLSRKPEAVYFSYGDRESAAKHPLLRTVGTETAHCFRHLQTLDIPCTLELNPGNHFQEGAQRTAKGIAWLADAIHR